MTNTSTKCRRFSPLSYLILLCTLMLCNTVAFGQTIKIGGNVKDKQNLPLIGTAVIEKGTDNGTVVDYDGNYLLSVSSSSATLVFQYIGYITQEQEISSRSTIDVVMVEDALSLGEVVVVGYGSVKRGDLTTAVSTVSTEDLDTRPITSASGALQGKAAGVQVIQTNGAPGQGMVVRIRGASSISSSNDPLYVVDGVPVGEGSNAIAFLSPNEIESMSVLKDASSAAIYGSRAANGVVLITTKNGAKSQGPSVSFSSYVGISNVAKTYDVLNTEQYIELMNESGAVSGLPSDLSDTTDWFDETYSTGINQNYQFSVSNANDKSSYYLGGGYTDEQGVITSTESKRYNVKANFDTKLYKWLSASASVTYSNNNSFGDIITGQGANRAGVVISAITTPTYAPIWDSENPDQYYNNFYGAELTSPLENIARTDYNQYTTDRLILTGGVTLNFTKDLSFKSTVTMDRSWYHASTFLDPIRTTYGRTLHGEASDTRSDDMRMVYDNILTYNKSFGDHNFEILGGTSATTSKWEQLMGYRSYFSDSNDNAITNLSGGNNGGTLGQYYDESEWSIMSYLARLSYNYKSKYLFTANVRADGSSKLAPDHRWGTFPSFSAAWRISGEKFMSGIDWISDLKLRAGWGMTGNQSGLEDYGYLQQYYTNYYDWTDDDYAQAVPTVGSTSNIKNEELTWETTTQTNVGVDLSLFKGRLSFTFDYYYKYTRDMLMSVDLPEPYPNIMRNEGEMSNRGLEITISSVNITKKDFVWTTDFNISRNVNKLESLELQQVYYYGMTSDVTNDYAIRMEPGQSLSMFWGYISDGVDPETGDLIYRDLNGDGEITPDDKSYIGDANPAFTFGITNNFSWKGFNLNVLVTGSYGNDIFNASRIETEGMYNGNNQTTAVLDRWQIPGQITDMPRATTDAYNLKNSTRWIEDGSYIKIKSITLAYDFTGPRLKKLNISRVQPYITLNNFITFTKYSGYDPEVSQMSDATQMGIDWGTYPNVKTAIVGLNVNF